jgi:hypothetical protein
LFFAIPDSKLFRSGNNYCFLQFRIPSCFVQICPAQEAFLEYANSKNAVGGQATEQKIMMARAAADLTCSEHNAMFRIVALTEQGRQSDMETLAGALLGSPTGRTRKRKGPPLTLWQKVLIDAAESSNIGRANSERMIAQHRKNMFRALELLEQEHMGDMAALVGALTAAGHRCCVAPRRDTSIRLRKKPPVHTDRVLQGRGADADDTD